LPFFPRSETLGDHIRNEILSLHPVDSPRHHDPFQHGLILGLECEDRILVTIDGPIHEIEIFRVLERFYFRGGITHLSFLLRSNP
jgi:hypothetical protein